MSVVTGDQHDCSDHFGTAKTSRRRCDLIWGCETCFIPSTKKIDLDDTVLPYPLLFSLDKGRMTPPHTPFKYLFRRHMWPNSRHSLDRAEAQHPSIETVSPVPEGGIDSSDEPHPTVVGGCEYQICSRTIFLNITSIRQQRSPAP